MATELHTNLILNDTRFTQGLERADRTFGRTMAGMSRSLETVNMAVNGYRKVVAIAQDVNNAWTKSLEIQQRLNLGVASYRDQWEKTHGWMALVADMSPIGQVIKDAGFNKQGGQLRETERGIQKEILERSAARERELTLMRYQTEEERALVALEQQHNKEITRLQQLDRASKADYSDEVREQEKLRDIQLQQLRAKQEAARRKASSEEELRLAKEVAEARLEAARAGREASRSTFDFNERIEAEDTQIMRLKGFDAEADRRSIEADTRCRIREVLDDQTVGPEELGRRLREVYRTSNERMALLKEKPPDAFDRSITASGVNSATLGQMFGPTMSVGNSIAAKQAAAAEKAAAENKRQTELLKSIDRGIQRVGTRYAS